MKVSNLSTELLEPKTFFNWKGAKDVSEMPPSPSTFPRPDQILYLRHC